MLDNIDDVAALLPKPAFNASFFALIRGLINRLNDEILNLQKTLNSLSGIDEEMSLEFIKEINFLNAVKSECEKLMIMSSEDEKSLVTEKKKKIIFATTECENVFLEEDIMDISGEYLGVVRKCLESLENGFEENNITKGKKLIPEGGLDGLHEIKGFKVRIIYKRLTPDTIYVIMARIKKDTFSKRDREEMRKRNEAVGNQYETLKKDMNDPEKKSRIILENEVIRDRIFRLIDERRRGK